MARSAHHRFQRMSRWTEVCLAAMGISVFTRLLCRLNGSEDRYTWLLFATFMTGLGIAAVLQFWIELSPSLKRERSNGYNRHRWQFAAIMLVACFLMLAGAPDDTDPAKIGRLPDDYGAFVIFVAISVGAVYAVARWVIKRPAEHKQPPHAHTSHRR